MYWTVDTYWDMNTQSLYFMLWSWGVCHLNSTDTRKFSDGIIITSVVLNSSWNYVRIWNLTRKHHTTFPYWLNFTFSPFFVREINLLPKVSVIMISKYKIMSCCKLPTILENIQEVTVYCKCFFFYLFLLSFLF